MTKVASGTFEFSFNGQTTAAITYAGSGAIAVGAATEVGNTVTIVTTAANNFVAGQPVTIAGVTSANYNGTFTIASVTSATTTFTPTPIRFRALSLPRLPGPRSAPDRRLPISRPPSRP